MSCCQSTPRLSPPPPHKAPYQQLKVAHGRKTWIQLWGENKTPVRTFWKSDIMQFCVFHSPVVLLHTATANGFQMVTSGAQSKAVSDWAITSLEVRVAKFKSIFLSFLTDSKATAQINEWHHTPWDSQPTFKLEKLVLSQALAACPSSGEILCDINPFWDIVTSLCFYNLRNVEQMFIFRLCLSNKASRRF